MHVWTIVKFFIIFFFFSSRRRHTRWPRDWSSDVCSSDLLRPGTFLVPRVDQKQREPAFEDVPDRLPQHPGRFHRHVRHAEEIGRASCRERVEIAVGGVAYKKEKLKRIKVESVCEYKSQNV